MKTQPMVKVESNRFGPLEVAPNQLLVFATGLVGFEECQRFALVEKGSPLFRWLQSLDHAELAFAVVDPRPLFPHYRPLVTAGELHGLDLVHWEQAALLCIVTVPAEPTAMTANLQAPILINPDSLRARQVISTDPQHPLRQPLLPALRSWTRRKTG